MPSRRNNSEFQPTRRVARGTAGSDGMMLTRRQLIAGAAGVVAVAAVAGAGVAATGAMNSANASDLPVLDVPEDAVFTTEDCEFSEKPSDVVKKTAEVKLPYGTLIWANDDEVAACLLPTDTGKPLSHVGVLSLSTGKMTTLLEHAVGESQGFEIYDVRATSNGMVWTEVDILDGNWRVYQAALSGKKLNKLGEPIMMAEGGSSWETPTIVACGNYFLWQTCPVPDGEAAAEPSTLSRATFGSPPNASEVVFTSPGRFACAPSPAVDGVAVAPRVKSRGVYYELVYINAATGTVRDRLVLPASMKPVEVAYGSTGFSFSFNAIYSYGGGIANLGTYTPTAAPALDYSLAERDALSSAAAQAKCSESALPEKDREAAIVKAETAICDLYSNAQWFRFPRTPYTAPAWCGKWFVVKSTKAVVAVDIAARRYVAFDVDDGAPDYGEYLASSGTSSRIVTFTNIDHTPVNGEATKECRLKIWEFK